MALGLAQYSFGSAREVPDPLPAGSLRFVVLGAESLLSPVGLSLATKLAPAAFRTQMVALFFPSIALGTAMSGS